MFLQMACCHWYAGLCELRHCLLLDIHHMSVLINLAIRANEWRLGPFWNSVSASYKSMQGVPRARIRRGTFIWKPIHLN